MNSNKLSGLSSIITKVLVVNDTIAQNGSPVYKGNTYEVTYSILDRIMVWNNKVDTNLIDQISL